MEILQDAFVYLFAAVVEVPIAKHLGLGSVLGYLLAGIFIGPVFGFVGSESEDIKHFAEFGVVIMLFLVGLELHPKTLWKMRNLLLGLGGLQVLGTTAIFTAIALLFDLPWQSSIAVGMILALSSTAIVLQTLNEKKWMKTEAGQSAFSVLLFQDIAVIPMLSILPLLAVAHVEGDAGGHGHGGGHLDSLPSWAQPVVILLVIAAIIISGRYLIRYAFRFIAATGIREIFTALAILLIVGISLIMDFVGLSPALGTFIAGVVLSDSEYRHELESDIEPFKGLLLGLFFITVGAGINFELLSSKPVLIVGLAAMLMFIKFGVLRVLANIFKVKKAGGWLFSLCLAQAGEFAFVLFSFAKGEGVLTAEVSEILTLVVTITMLLTPLLFILYESVIAKKVTATEDRNDDEINEKGTAILAGVGRFGQIISRMMLTSGYKVVVLDKSSKIVDLMRKVDLHTYYGDASRPDLLEASGLSEAKLFVAAMDDREKQVEVVRYVAKNHPNVKIIARAFDRHHGYELEIAGAHYVEREMFEGSLLAGIQALTYLGMHPFKAHTQARNFRKHDRDTLRQFKDVWLKEDGFSKNYLSLVKKRRDDLYTLMQTDRHEEHDRSERGWAPPPKGDATI